MRKLLIPIAVFAMLLCGCGKQEKKLKIGISVPAATHGWTGGVVWHAEQAKKRIESANPDVSVTVATSGSGAAQVNAIETLMMQNPDALVILSQEPEPLDNVCKQAKKRIIAEETKAQEVARSEEIMKQRLEEKHQAFLQRQEVERIAKEEQAKQQKEAHLKRLHEQLQEEARKQAEEEHLRLKKLWNEGNRSFSEKRAKLHLQSQQIAKEIATLRKEEELAHKNRRRNEPTQKIQNLREDLMFANRKLILKQNELELLQEQDQLWKERAATVENYKQAVSSTHFERIMKDVTEKREAITTRIKDLKQEMNDLRNYMNDIRSELQGA